MLRINADDFSVGLDGGGGTVEFDVSVSEFVPGIGTLWIGLDSLAIGCDGMVAAVKIKVNIPKVVPDVGIGRAESDGLAISLDRLFVTFEAPVSDPKIVPGNGIFRFAFRPLPTPIKQTFPVLLVYKVSDTLPPFSLAVIF